MSTRDKAGADAGASPFEVLAELGGKAIENVEGISRLVQGVKFAAEAIREIAVRKTEQTRVRVSADVEIERIHAVRDVMLSYLDRSFDERRKNFDALFTRLDAVIAAGNIEVVAQTLDALVELAKSSPFKDLTDVATAKAALRDKGRDWVF